MMLLKKQCSKSAGLGPSSYTPEKLRVKFDKEYFVATTYTKQPKICQLETRHDVNIGTAYANENAGKDFMHYTAESRRRELKQTLANARFFSLLLEGSTDGGNVDDKVVLAVWCDCNRSDEKVHTWIKHFSVM